MTRQNIKTSFQNNKLSIFLSLLFYLSLFFLFYKNTIVSMILQWYNDPNYSHGFIIPLISGYIIWQKKDTLKNVEHYPTYKGIIVFLLGIILFIIGYYAGESFTMRFSMLVTLAGSILFLFGWKLFRSISFPLFYLIFMIPLPYIVYNSFAFPLKLFVSKISVAFLKFMSIPVLREGNIIYLPNITLEVVEACSGIRSIISLLALSTALAYFTQKTYSKKIILILFSIPIAIFTNSLRIIVTGILASYRGASVAEGFFHEFTGISVFIVAFILLFAISYLLSKSYFNSKL